MFGDRGIEIKSPAQIEKMREAGLVVARTLERVRDCVRPGVTTIELDRVAEESIRSSGAVPSFKGYHGFPGSICTSVNDEVVHGIPGTRVIRDGDVVSIDCGAIVDGWHGDAAVTVGVGEVDDAARRLIETTERAMWAGIAQVRAGNRLSDIGHAVERVAAAPGYGVVRPPEPLAAELLRVTEEAMWRGIAAAALGGRVGDISHAVESYVRGQGDYGVVEDYVGHGIGSAMHQPPNVPNVGRPGRGAKLVRGLALAVEPMIVLGDPDTHVLDDDWTVVTDDTTLAAHFENTFTLTPTGTWVLTEPDGGRARLAELGVPFGGPPPTR
jgi:methionyl aminopeptidase